MPLQRLRRLLDQLDRTYHSDRVRMMALVGRDHADDPALHRLLDEVASKSQYHQGLTLVAATAAGDDERLHAALGDPSATIRSLALANIASEHLPAEQILEEMLSGSAEDRRMLRQFIIRRRLTNVAETVIDRIRDELGDREAGALLATCAEGTVRRLLPDLLYAIPNLRSLAKRHPTILLDHTEEELQTLSRRQRDLLWVRIDATIPELAVAQPDRLLRLVEETGPSCVIPPGLARRLASIIRFDPARVARLLVSDQFVARLGWRLPPVLARNAGRFDIDDQVAIPRALRENEFIFFQWIGSLAPSRRGEVFNRAIEDLDTTSRVWNHDSLAILPRDLRHSEARRILGVRFVRESEGSTLQYTAFLPFVEARERLTAQLRRPKAEERAVGYDLLISCARRDRSPTAMRDALVLCERLKNEQEPVRLSAVQALAASSASLFDDDALVPLRSLTDAALEARDTSSNTLRQLNDLGVNLLVDASGDDTSPRFQFALDLLDQLAGLTGSLSFPQLDHLLQCGSEGALVDALMPRLEQAAKLGRYRIVVELTSSLGERAWPQQGLQRLLEAATTASEDRVVTTALSYWLADPRTRGERAASALETDESMLTDPTVLMAVVRSRQDLLDVLFRSRPLKGRLLTGDVRFVPIVNSSFDRWLPRQHEAYRAALDSLIATPGTAERTRTAAIRTLARLPGIGAAALEPYLASPQVAIQEAALSGLAWTDEPGRSLNRLLTFAATDRARVAIYAATRCARFVPRAELRRPLQSILLSDNAKITSKNEAARLIGTNRPPGAVDLLLDAAATNGVHRDLQVAIGRSLRGLLDDDRAWLSLVSMSAGSHDVERSLLDTSPDQLAPRHRSRFAELVVDACRSTARLVRAEALASLANWGRWSPRAPNVACEAIADLDSGPEWLAALLALTTMLQDGIGWEETSNLTTSLLGRSDIAAHDAGAERDRPTAQRLQDVLVAASGLPRPERHDHRADLLHLAGLLSDRPRLALDEFSIRLAALDWTDPTATLATAGLWLDDHPLLADRAMGAMAHALDRDQTTWGHDSLAGAADHLIGIGSAGSGVLALQLVQSAGKRFSWPEPWRARLRALRSHPVDDVGGLADRVWTAHE